MDKRKFTLNRNVILFQLSLPIRFWRLILSSDGRSTLLWFQLSMKKKTTILFPKTEKITVQADPWLMSLVENNIQHTTKNRIEIFECVPCVSSYLRARLISAVIIYHKQWTEIAIENQNRKRYLHLCCSVLLWCSFEWCSGLRSSNLPDTRDQRVDSSVIVRLATLPSISDILWLISIST